MVDLRHPDGGVLDEMEAAFAPALPAICEPLGLGVADAADLGSARGALRRGLRRGGAPRARSLSGLFVARHRLGRRPRRGLCFARRAGRDDLRAVPRRHQPQRGGVFLQGAVRQGRAGAAAGGARLRPACWPSAAALRRARASGPFRLRSGAVRGRLPCRLERQHQAHARSARHHGADRDRRGPRRAAGRFRSPAGPSLRPGRG